MSKRLILVVSLAFGVLLILATVEIGNALALSATVTADRRAGTTVNFQGTEILWEDFVVHHLAPQALGPARSWLLRCGAGELTAAQYAIAGLGGGLFAYWLWLLGMRSGSPERMGRPWLRILAGGVAGLLVYLVLRLPLPLLAKWPALEGGMGGVSTEILLDSGHALAALAGLFLATFVESLRGILKLS